MKLLRVCFFALGFLLLVLSAKSVAQVADFIPPPVPVPEPATAFLLGAGLIGVGLILRKRRKS